MSKALFALLALGLLTALSASAQVAGTSTQVGASFSKHVVAGYTLGGGSPPPPCSNSLDFSDQCNSQYLGIGWIR